MKKRVVAFFLVLTMVFLLCGCDALDQLQAQRGKYQWKDVVFQGVTYKKLPICPALNPQIDYERPVYVVEEDVPLLLTVTHADATFYQSADGNFLLQSQGSEVVFCREELYDQLSSTIAKGWEYTKVYYRYLEVQDYDYHYEKYMLTQEQMDALETLTTNVEPQKLTAGISLDSDWRISLYECSEDGYFQREGGQIAGVGSSYYLLTTDHQLNQLAFKVPDGLVSTFDDIVEAYFSAYETELEFEQSA